MSPENKYSDRLEAAQFIRTMSGKLENLQAEALAGLKFNAQISDEVRMILGLPSGAPEGQQQPAVNMGELAVRDASTELYAQKLRCNVMQRDDVDELMSRFGQSGESSCHDIGPLVVVNGLLLYRVPHSLDAHRGLFPERREGDGKVHASLIALNAGFILKPTRCIPSPLSGVDFTVQATDSNTPVYGFRIHKKELEYALARTDKGVTMNFSPDSIAGYDALYGK